MNVISRYLVVLLLVSSSDFGSAQDKYEIINLSFNTNDFNEFCPVVFNNQLIFCSNKKRDVFISNTNPDGEPLPDIYMVSPRGNNKWSDPVLFSLDLTTRFTEGPFTFEPDGSRIYFTRHNDVEKTIGNSLDPGNRFGIYMARNVNGQWQNIRAFQKSTNSHYAYPSISPNGEYMVFSSTEPGGYGGFDLYIVYKRGARWSRPESLGPQVNTSRDEVFPFLHSSGRLYFSSNGLEGEGRLDLFYTYQTEDTWTTPVNLGELFNSRFDDFGIYVADDFETGYFTSKRRATLDIFSFKLLFPQFEECKEVEENNYCFVFYETGSLNLDTTSFKYEWDLGDGTKIRGLEAEHCFAGPGDYTIQLNVIDTLTGETYFNEASYDFPLKDIEQVVISAPDTAYAGEEVIMDGLGTYFENFTPQNYYWYFGDGNVATGSTVTYVYQKPGTYTIKLGVKAPIDENSNIRKECGYTNIVILPNRTGIIQSIQ